MIVKEERIYREVNEGEESYLVLFGVVYCVNIACILSSIPDLQSLTSSYSK